MTRFLRLALAGLLLLAPSLAHAAGPDKPMVMDSGVVRQLPPNVTVQLNAAGAGNASVNEPQGAAPSSPTNGDRWTTSAGFFGQAGGVTYGPFGPPMPNPFCFKSSGPCFRYGGGAPGATSDPVGSLYQDVTTPDLWQQVVPGGVAPTLVSGQAVNFNGTSGTLPNAPTAGNLLLAACWGYTTPPTPGSGWSDTGIVHNPSVNEPGDRWYYKTAGIGESASQTPCVGPTTAFAGSLWEVAGVTLYPASFETSVFSGNIFGSGSANITYTTTNSDDLVLGSFADRNGTGSGAISGLTPTFSATTKAVSAAQSFAASGAALNVTGSFAGCCVSGRILVLKPATGAYRKLSFLTTIKNAGSTIESEPFSLNCGTALSCSTDGFGNVTVASSVNAVTTTGSPASGNLTKFSGATTITSGDLSGDCTTSGTLAVVCLKTNGVSFGSFATQDYATPPAIGGTTPAAGSFSSLKATNIASGTQCVHADSSGNLTGTGSDCGAGGGGSLTFKDEGTTLTAATTSVDCVGAGVTCTNSSGAVTLTVSGGGGGSQTIVAPGGRLTLVSGTPVMASDQTAKSQVYYTCQVHKNVPYYDGSADQIDSIGSCEVSMTMQTSGTGVTNSGGVFDVFWDPAHHSICVATNGSGGGWASDTGGSNTARGSGYSQVHNTRGYWTNQNSLTHCYNGTTDYGSISADRATYLGSLYTTAAGQTGMAFKPTAAAGGTNNVLGLWNAYNQVVAVAISRDSTTTSWSYATATWRAANASNSNRISYIDGLGTSPVSGEVVQVGSSGNAATTEWMVGVNFDSTSATPDSVAGASSANLVTGTAAFTALPKAGLHFAQAMEDVVGGATCVFYAFVNSAQQNGLTIRVLM